MTCEKIKGYPEFIPSHYCDIKGCRYKTLPGHGHVGNYSYSTYIDATRKPHEVLCAVKKFDDGDRTYFRSDLEAAEFFVIEAPIEEQVKEFIKNRWGE